jgi:SAM-dependent methyltransferase
LFIPQLSRPRHCLSGLPHSAGNLSVRFEFDEIGVLFVDVLQPVGHPRRLENQSLVLSAVEQSVWRLREPRTATGCEMARAKDRRLSFDAAAEIYDEVRPSYPAALFEVLFDLLPPRPEVVEVGPGTGQATRDLLARGASVRAIEIGPNLAAKLGSNLASERLRISIGDFEKIEIAARSADAVFSATAYHWISRAAQTDRPAAILRLGGVIAIVDLIQVDSPSDLGFFAAAQPIYDRYGEGHAGPPAPTRDNVASAMQFSLEADPRFGHVAVRKYDWDQTYSASDYRKLMLSYSDTQMMDESARIALLDDMQAFIEDNFDGVVTRPLVVTLTTAVLLSPQRPSSAFERESSH